MEGGKNHPPRTVITRDAATKEYVQSYGEDYPKGTPKATRVEQSHIKLKKYVAYRKNSQSFIKEKGDFKHLLLSRFSLKSCKWQKRTLAALKYPTSTT